MPPPQGSFNPLEGPGDYTITKTVHSDTYDAIDSANADLSGKAVFVVGGSKGIGKETVLSYAKAGVSKLAVGARSNVEALQREVRGVAKDAGKHAPQFLPVTIDIKSRESIEAAAKAIEGEFGRLDILVIVAAAFPELVRFTDLDPDIWWSTIEVNVRGPFLLCRSFMPLLLKSERGLKAICTVASVGAWLTGPTCSTYQVSKTAAVRLADFVGAEYAGEGITSFSVHPGNVPTELLGPDGPRPEIKHIFVDTTRLPADTMVWLTKESRPWLNGRYINCTWDMLELEARKDEIVKRDLLKTTLRV